MSRVALCTILAAPVLCGGCGDDVGGSDDAGAPDGSADCGAVEVCDQAGRDEDCDPDTVGELDRDEDGFVDQRCCNRDATGAVVACGDDCHDLVDDVHPGASELCDGYDNDCDGQVDEGTKVERYRDVDQDGFAAPDAGVIDVCDGAPGSAEAFGDCDDTNANAYPGAPELCDLVDNDCDGEPEQPGTEELVLWYPDGDVDGFGTTEAAAVSCAPPPFPLLCLPFSPTDYCAAGKGTPVQPENASQHHVTGWLTFATRRGDCEDVDDSAHPDGAEICNARDDDCDGRPDFALGVNDFEDDDGDLVLDPGCARGDDCDDMDALTGPNMPEICDHFDNDCDGKIDENVDTTSWYPDRDSDGFGDAEGEVVERCAHVAGHSTNSDDCDDDAADRRPQAFEACNGLDDDCDGLTDEEHPGCDVSGTIAGRVVRADGGDPVAGAHVSLSEHLGHQAGHALSDADGDFELPVAARWVVLVVEPPGDAALVGVARAIVAPASDLRVELETEAAWDARLDEAGATRDHALGIVEIEIEGPWPAGGQGVLISDPGQPPFARVGTTTAEGSLLPAYTPPLDYDPTTPFATITYLDVPAGEHNLAVSDARTCETYAVENLTAARSAQGAPLRMARWPVRPRTATIVRVDCGRGLETCCAAHGMPGCGEPTVQACVCTAKPDCCGEGGWDDECVALVEATGCSTCARPIPSGAQCCGALDLLGCNLEPISDCVCEFKPECCQGPWESECANAIVPLRCGACPGQIYSLVHTPG